MRLDFRRMHSGIDLREVCGREICAVVDAPVVAHEGLEAHLIPNGGVVRVSVEEHRTEGHHVHRVLIGKRSRAVRVVPLCERLHELVDLLGLARAFDRGEEQA